MSEQKYGFVTLEEADAYFATRLGADEYWSSGAPKEKALLTAYNQIISHPDYENITECDKVKKAQCEQALFLLAFNNSIFRRSSLQSQGVISTDILGENYDLKKVDNIPLTPVVKVLLREFQKGRLVGFIEL